MKSKNLIHISISICFFVFIIVIYLNITGCDNDKIIHEYAGSVEGTVIDSLTRLPIDSAWINGTPDTTYEPLRLTDSLGYYLVSQFPGSHVFFYCGKKGYVTKESQEFEIKINKTTQVDFELVPQKE